MDSLHIVREAKGHTLTLPEATTQERALSSNKPRKKSGRTKSTLLFTWSASNPNVMSKATKRIMVRLKEELNPIKMHSQQTKPTQFGMMLTLIDTDILAQVRYKDGFLTMLSSTLHSKTCTTCTTASRWGKSKEELQKNNSSRFSLKKHNKMTRKKTKKRWRASGTSAPKKRNGPNTDSTN